MDENMQTDAIKNNVDRHVDANDYAGTVATIIDLQLQTMRKKNLPPRQLRNVQKSLETLRDEFLYLQEDYQIVKRF